MRLRRNIFVCCLLVSATGLCLTARYLRSRGAHHASKMAIVVNLEAMKRRLKAGDWNAILEMGNSADKNYVPLLRDITSDDQHGMVIHARAKLALAKLGEENEFLEICRKLKSENPRFVSEAIEGLAYVGDERSVSLLGPILFSTVGFRTEKGVDDVIYDPPAYTAAAALSKNVPTGPVALKRDAIVTMADVKAWQKWWRSTHRSIWDRH